MSVGLFNDNASFAQMNIAEQDKSIPEEGEPVNFVFKHLLTDSTAINSYKPSRFLRSPYTLDLTLAGDIVVKCKFKFTEIVRSGGYGKFEDYCFGIITYKHPMKLSVCTSVPTEYTLQASFGFQLQKFKDESAYLSEDEGFKRKRRDTDPARFKRQSDEYLRGFLFEEILNSSHIDVLDYLNNLDPSESEVTNGKLLSGENLGICVRTGGLGMQILPAFKLMANLESIDGKPSTSNQVCINLPPQDQSAQTATNQESSNTDTGGSTDTGGNTDTGGSTNTGDSNDTGGNTDTGGSTNTGDSNDTGDNTDTGDSSDTGGSINTGDNSSTGDSSGTEDNTNIGSNTDVEGSVGTGANTKSGSQSTDPGSSDKNQDGNGKGSCNGTHNFYSLFVTFLIMTFML